MDWPDTRLCRLLGIEHPIIQAPMLGTCTPGLASAVANAGGLGSLGCSFRSPEVITEQVRAIRAGTNRSFNLNFFVTPEAATPPEVLTRTRELIAPWYDSLGLGSPPDTLSEYGASFDDTVLECLLDLSPRVASFHFGVPEPHQIAALKAAGIVLLSSATCVDEARLLERAGMDAIIAQGWEAGGHRGSFHRSGPQDGVGTMALVPQIVDAVRVPVIAAGGITDARGIVAALALGASGVQMGTAFLRTPEANTKPGHRAQVARAKDTDSMATDAYSGRVARAMRSRFAEEMARADGPLPDFMQMYDLSEPVREAAPDDEASFYLYGQAASLSREAKAGEVVAQLVAETEAILARLRPT